MTEKKRAILADRIFTGEEWLNGYAVIAENGIINALCPASAIPADMTVEVVEHAVMIPAFIDVQLYGAFGKLLAVYPGKDCLEKINDYCLEGGACLSLPTIATNTHACMIKCIDAIRDYWKQGGEGIYGLHIEGPWINPAKRGAHIESLIHPPAKDELKDILEYGKGVVRMITMAPEFCSKDIIDLVRSYDIICSAGHSNATYEEAMTGFDHGFTTVTHLYNAMSPLQHRAPGLVGAAMDHQEVMASIIPDGYHVDFAAIRIAKKIMGERLFAITDAVTETTEGYYPHQKNGDKYESGGILSGSALNMLKAFRNLVDFSGISFEEASRMCSLYPAKLLGINMQYGLIKPGFFSNLLLLSNDNELITVITK